MQHKHYLEINHTNTFSCSDRYGACAKEVKITVNQDLTEGNCPYKCKQTISYQPTQTFMLHHHNSFELYLFICGDVDYFVEGKVYHLTPNSLILLPPEILHGSRINSSAKHIRMSIYFTPEALTPKHCKALLSFLPTEQKERPRELYYESVDTFNLSYYFTQLYQIEDHLEDSYSFCYTIFLEALLAQIILMSQKKYLSTSDFSSNSLVLQIIDYLNEHLSEQITLDFLSKHFFISKSRMNNIFKKFVGTTVIDYLIHKRVLYAKQLILNGSTAFDAAFSTGFSDYSSFYRDYRKIIGSNPNSSKVKKKFTGKNFTGQDRT